LSNQNNNVYLQANFKAMITDLLKRVTNSLEIKDIPYMLSGSLALNAYTVPRMSLDIDIVIELHEEHLLDFFEIFKDDYYINENTVKEEIKRRGMFNVIDHKTGFKVDFIIKKETEYRKHEFSRRIRESISDFDVWIVSPEDLVISKIDWIQQYQSDKQINDIQNLLSISTIDLNYIKLWCNKLNLYTFELL
jgi:phosphoribosylpyrophosphate synthetase